MGRGHAIVRPTGAIGQVVELAGCISWSFVLSSEMNLSCLFDPATFGRR